MRKLLLAAALCGATMMTAPATAAITFDLTGVTLQGGGSLNGWFSLSDDLSTLVDYSITSTTNSSIYGHFTGRTYTKAGAWFTQWQSAQGLLAVHLSPTAQLNLFFVSGSFSSSGGTFDQSASETQNVVNGGTRTVLSGGVVAQGAVPEPASWALMIGGFALAGAAIRSRKVQFTAA